MKKYSDIVQITIFMVIIVGFMIAMFLVPDKEFSEQENRVLATAPSFSAEALKSGQLMKDIEVYLTDQFPGRDNWIGAKSYAERLVGKTENNNVFFCKDDTLIKRFEEPDRTVVDKNIESINAFIENTDLPVYMSLIPGAVSIWEEKLPVNAQNCNQKELIEEIYAAINCETVDNYTKLETHSGEYIYYRTDHHWTSLGAYYGYTAVADAMGFTPVDISVYTKDTVNDEFYGTVYSSSGVRWVKPDLIDKYVPEEGIVVNNMVGNNPTPGVFYDYEKLNIKDKYTFFFGGNAPLVKITTAVEDGGALLVIRDSYSDCEMPFLTSHYSEIFMMDLRYYKFGLNFFLQQNKVDAVLINYSVSNFCEDRNLALIAY